MIYLLDANVIDANRDYYPIDRVPEFWGWLEHHGSDGGIKVPSEMFEEVKSGRDALAAWARQQHVSDALVLREDPCVVTVARVIDEGYANDLTDTQTELLGQDPFLIAYALIRSPDRCVVTTERSKPTRIRHNRHVPDVCNHFGVRCCDTFAFTKHMDFRTNWRR